MNLSDSNDETKISNDIETLKELIEEEIHWFIKLLNFFKMLKIC